MRDLDRLIENAVGQAELSTTTTARVALARATTPDEKRLAVLIRPDRQARNLNVWTPEEDAFLAASIGKLHEEEIARLLGRTRTAVHIHWKRCTDIPAPSKSPDILTGEQIAEGLHVDGKTVHLWIDRGLLSGRRLPADDVTRVVRRVTLLRWLINPHNWVYFDPQRVGKYGPRRGKSYDYEFWSHARRLVLLARSRWHDEWWTVGQVCAYHHVDQAVANNAIHDGRLAGGVKWGNWHVLKSIAVKCTRLHTGKGSNAYKQYSAGLDELILLGTAIGLSVNVLSAYSGLCTAAICYRRSEMQRKRLVTPLIRTRGLAIDYTPRTGRSLPVRGHPGISGGRLLFADWKQHRTRFKALAVAMDKFKKGDALDRIELGYVRGVLHVWCDRFYRERDRATLLSKLYTLGRTSADRLRGLYLILKRAGIDPYKRPPLDLS